MSSLINIAQTNNDSSSEIDVVIRMLETYSEKKPPTK